MFFHENLPIRFVWNVKNTSFFSAVCTLSKIDDVDEIEMYASNFVLQCNNYCVYFPERLCFFIIALFSGPRTLSVGI